MSSQLNSNGTSNVMASASSSSSSSSSGVDENEPVICLAVRTPIGRGRRGSLKDTPPDKLLEPLFVHVIEQCPKLDLNAIGDVIIGQVLTGGLGATQVRVATLMAGLPVEVPCSTVNRQCSSGLQAIVNAMANIRAGNYQVAIAGGVESMSKNWGAPIDTTQLNMDALGHEMASGCYHSMLQTSDEVSARFSMDRQKCDEVAVESHRKADAARSSGRFRDEIVPMTATYMDAEGNEKTVTLSDDEGVRPGTTMEALGRLKPALGEGGVTTAGNASQVSDGAAVVLVASRAAARRYSLPIIGRLVSSAVVGVEPAIMGVGPAAAIPVAAKRGSLNLSDVKLFEINEAFASQYRYSIEHLGIDPNLVNVNGGAIALGHPLGCTGGRLVVTLLHELKKRNERIGCVSMCIGSGMGMAAFFERL